MSVTNTEASECGDAERPAETVGGCPKLPFWRTKMASWEKYALELDRNGLDSIREPAVLARLCLMGKIKEWQYERATVKLHRELDGAFSICRQGPIEILYPDSPSSDLTISPTSVLELLEKPRPLPLDITPSIRVDLIGDNMFVKFGSFNPAEAKTMLFIREHTKIPVPKVHLVFTVRSDTFIVMEYVSGGDLQHRWPSLQESERRSVLSQVHGYLQELRTIVPPCDTPGPLGGGVCIGRWFTEYGAGPFPSHQDLVNWWNAWVPGDSDSDGRPSSGERLSADKPLVFTHCDIAPRNLVLHDGVVWMVDWGLAGWFPEYLEYCYLASETGSCDYLTPDDWTQELLAIVPAYPNEFAFLQKIFPRYARV